LPAAGDLGRDPGGLTLDKTFANPAHNFLWEPTMNAADATSITSHFPSLQTLQHQHQAEAMPPVDAALIHLCVKLRKDQQDKHRFDVIDEPDWESFNQESTALRSLVKCIADTPATSRIGLRAKALALRALLDEGCGDLYEDAASPDLLAWSLIQDILTE
jgi:hypothetical protein